MDELVESWMYLRTFRDPEFLVRESRFDFLQQIYVALFLRIVFTVSLFWLSWSCLYSLTALLLIAPSCPCSISNLVRETRLGKFLLFDLDCMDDINDIKNHEIP